MTPRRMGRARTWSYAFDRSFKGVGRIQAKAWTQRVDVFRRRDALLVQLYEDGRLDLLTALKDGTLTVVQIEAARRTRTLDALDATGSTAAPLWDAVEAALSRQARAPIQLTTPTPSVTVEGYRKSFRALQLSDVMGARPVVADLLRTDWVALEASWGRSPASWNQLIRALSRFCTLHFGSRAHDATVRLMALVRPTARDEVPREPDVNPAAIWAALEHVKAEYRPPIVALVLTGLRRSELGRLTRDDLLPITRGVQVTRRAKNKTSKRTIGVPEEAWPWLVAAVPVPVRMDTILAHWRAACTATGLGRVTLHDLRHCFGQFATDMGVDEGMIQKAMGHKTRHQTQIYTARKERRQAANAVATMLGVRPTQTPTEGKKADEA